MVKLAMLGSDNTESSAESCLCFITYLIDNRRHIELNLQRRANARTSATRLKSSGNCSSE